MQQWTDSAGWMYAPGFRHAQERTQVGRRRGRTAVLCTHAYPLNAFALPRRLVAVLMCSVQLSVRHVAITNH